MKRYIRKLFNTLFVLFTVFACTAFGWVEGIQDGFKRRLTIRFETTNGITQVLQDYPILVKLETSNFPFMNRLAPDGRDIRFYDSDNETPLNFDIDVFDTNNEILVWVRIPELDARAGANDFIYMYFDNPNAISTENKEDTYTTDFVGVWHVNPNSQTKEIAEATGRDRTLIPFGASDMAPIAGIVGEGVSTTRRGYYQGEQQVTSGSFRTLSIEYWIRIPADPDATYYTFSRGAFLTGINTSEQVILQTERGWGWDAPQEPGNNLTSSPFTVDENTWHHIIWSLDYDAQVYTFFADGEFIKTGSLTERLANEIQPFLFGTHGQYQSPDNAAIYEGSFDELRAHRVARNASYAKATYLTITDNEALSVYVDPIFIGIEKVIQQTLSSGDVVLDMYTLEEINAPLASGVLISATTGEEVAIPGSITQADTLRYQITVPAALLQDVGFYDVRLENLENMSAERMRDHIEPKAITVDAGLINNTAARFVPEVFFLSDENSVVTLVIQDDGIGAVQSIRITSLQGKEIANLEVPLRAGVLTVEWDGLNTLGYKVESGVYFAVVDYEQGRRFASLYLQRR